MAKSRQDAMPCCCAILKQNFRRIGAASEPMKTPARKRITRAVEKLRNYFSKRGVTLTATILAGAVSANSIKRACCAGKNCDAVAIVKGAAATTSTLTLVKGALKLMAWTKAKAAIIAAGNCVLAAGITTVMTVRVMLQQKRCCL